MTGMDNPTRVGFQSRYFYDPLFRRQTAVRESLDEELKNNLEAADRHKPAKSQGDKPKSSPEQVTQQKLNQLVEQSKDPLLEIKTAVPLNPFPHKVIVDIHKVTIIFQYFFYSKQIHSIYVKDISDVLIETSLFFSTLKIIDVGYTDNSINVNYLSTEDAHKARRMIQGLIVAHKTGLDLSKYLAPDLPKKLEELGKS